MHRRRSAMSPPCSWVLGANAVLDPITRASLIDRPGTRHIQGVVPERPVVIQAALTGIDPSERIMARAWIIR